jgi:hypothetical protein
MKYVSLVALLISGVIHLVPVSGALGATHLSRLYGIDVDDTNLAILLQHRAFLFGILGVFMLAAIPLASIRIAALLVGLFSAASFVLFAFFVGDFNDAIRRIVIADVAISILLVAGLVAELIISKANYQSY